LIFLDPDALDLVTAVQSSQTLSQTPECNVDPAYREDAVGNAGCFIVVNGKLVVVRHRWGGKLGFPAGHFELNESAQCTAHRETWEEAGLHVRVGARLLSFNDFFLYNCSLIDEVDSDRTSFPLPPQARNEITEVLLVNLSDIDHEEWRFPEQLEVILNLFSRTRKSDA